MLYRYGWGFFFVCVVRFCLICKLMLLLELIKMCGGKRGGIRRGRREGGRGKEREGERKGESYFWLVFVFFCVLRFLVF